MPANKRQQDADEKREEILVEARRLFVEAGYEATSMAAVARAAGVASNTVYWYFADKDAVLVAVLDAVLADVLTEYEQVASAPLAEQIHWVVRKLQQLHRLVGTVHSRAAHSPAVDKWHTEFHTITEDMFRATLEQAGVDPAGIDAEVKIGVFAIEGVLTHGLDDAQLREICRRLAQRWTD